MKKRNITVFEIICYVVAVLLALTGLYLMMANIKSMNEYLAAYGVNFLALGGQAVQTLISAAGPYFAYAFFAVAAGKIYHVAAALKCECDCTCDCEEPAAEEVLELEAPVEALEAPKSECECECECTCTCEAEETPVEEKKEEVVAVVWAQAPEAVVVEDEEK